MKYNYYPKSMWNNSILEYCELPLNKPQYIKTVVDIVWNKCLEKPKNIFKIDNSEKGEYIDELII